MIQRTLRPIFWLVLATMLFGVLPPATAPAVLAAPAYDRQDRTGQVAAPALAVQPQPLTPIASVSVPHPEPPPPSVPARARIGSDTTPDLAQLPLSFVPNVGQLDARVRYTVRDASAQVFFTNQDITIAVPFAKRPALDASGQAHRAITATQTLSMSVVRLNYEGATARSVVATDPLPGKVNFLQGNDQSAWHTNIPTFAGITYQQLYPGIDLRYAGDQGALKSTYTIAPKADPSRLRWRYIGAQDVRVDAAGNLLILIEKPGFARVHASDAYTITEQAPTAWQIIQGRRVDVAVRFQLSAADTVSFGLGAYNTAYPLVIDPTIVYSRVLGGGAYEEALDLAVDNAGNAYVTGYTQSMDFPTMVGVVQPNCNVTSGTCLDVFVTRLSNTGVISYSTFFGGNSYEQAYGIAVSNDQHAYITGYTNSTDFPVRTANAFDTTCGGVFVVKFAVDGHDTDYSSCFDASGALDIDVDSSGAAYIAGSVLNGLFTRHSIDTDDSLSDAFVAKFNPSASTGDASLVYSTYISGDENEYASGIVVDSNGTAFITGASSSTLNFPITSQAYQQQNLSLINPSGQHDADAFITKLAYNAQNATLSNEYTTFLGGPGPDAGSDIAIDAVGNAYVTGITGAAIPSGGDNFPTTPGSWDRTYAGGGSCLSNGCDSFAAKISSSGHDLLYSGFFGDDSTEESGGIAVVPATGAATIVGYSNHPIAGGYQADAYVVTIAPDGSNIGPITYIGGSGHEEATGVAIDGAGNTYVAGFTYSLDFPAKPAQTINDEFNSFVVKLAPGSSLRPEQARGPEDCLDCALHSVVANWFTAWPVNTRTGDFWTSVTDLAVQSPGPALTWSRSYASQATEDLTTTLGFGWQHPYNARLILPTTTGGTVTVLSGRGNQLRFVNNNGTYQADAGIYSTLVRASGLYTQTLRDQSQLVFSDTTGRLVGMRDALGRALTLTYTGSPARLTQIADANNTTRKLTLTYYASGRINTVSDGTRTVTYTYDAATSDLKTVQDVRGQTTQYTYVNHLLTQITDPLGQVVEQMSYSGSGNTSKVIAQTLQSGEQIQFSYLAATTVMTTTGVDGRRDVRRINYGSDNAMTGMQLNGQSILGSGFDSSFSPSSVVDGNDKQTSTVYTSAGLPLQQTNALAQTTRLQYDTNRPTLITDTLGLTTRYDYDKLGNLLKITAGITTTSSIRAITSYTYHYLNASNSWVPLSQPLSTPFPKDSRLFEQTSSDGVVTRYEYTGTNPHQVTKTIVGADTALNQATTYGYDSLGRVTSTTTAFGTALARTDTTSYNADNTIAQTIQNYKNGVYDVHFPDEDIITQYGYDAIGRQIWVKDALGHYDVTHYNAKGQVDWTARNMSGYSGGALPATPPAYGLATTDANIATFYGYDGLGRTVLVTETGILTGTINTTTLQFSATISRTTRTEYDTLSRPMTVTLNYRPGMPQTADMNVPLYTRYDGAGNVITQTDTLGRWTVTRYDALNRPVMVITNYQDGVVSANEPTDQDSITGTEYDVGGRVARTIENWVNPPLVPQFDPNKPDINRVTVYAYDTLGRVTSTTQNYAPGSTGTALNRVSLTEFHPTTGRVTGQRDALGRWVNQQYDLLGRTITTIQNCTNSGGTPVNPAQAACAAFSNSFPDRNVPTQTAYDALNRVTDGTNTVNATTTVINHAVYDGLGRTLKQIQNYKSGTNGGSYSASTPDTNVTTSSLYDALGRTLAMTDTLGVATRTTVNALGQAITTTDPVGRVTQQGYDGSGMLRWSKRPDGQLTVFFIDGLGRVVTTIVNYKDGVAGANEPADTDLISRTIYDKAGRRIETVDANTRRTVFAYDNQDRLIGVTENAVSGTCALAPCTVVTAYGYDRAGNRTTITNALGVIRTFTYDAANQQTQATEPITAGTNRVTQWQYDAAGRMTKRIDPRGPNFDVSFGYDGMDRPTTTSASGMTTITNSYDGLGRRTQLVDGNTTTFTPDALGRITAVNAVGTTGTVNYTYDGLGRRTKLVYPTTGTTLNYSYLADGRLNTVTQGTSSPPTIARYSYDSVGRLVQSVTNASASITSQLVTNYGYDGTDRLTRQRTSEAGTTISGFDYQLNRNGLRTVITETLPLSPTISTTRIKTMTFEGASLTDATTGADSLSPATAPTVALEAAAPIRGAYSATIANLGATSLREDFTAATDAYVTVYVRLNALPSSNTRIMQISNSGTTAGELLVLTNGKLRLRNNGTTIGLDSSALTVGAVYRVGVHQKSGSGTGVLEAFLAAGDAQFTSAFAASSTLTIAGAANRVNIGPTSSTNPMNLTLDEIAVDTAGLAGPVASSARRADGAAAPTGTIDPFAAQPSAEGSPARALAGRLPIAFIPNAGQHDAGVRFQARGLAGDIWFGADETRFALRTPTRDTRPGRNRARPRTPRAIPPTVVQQRWIGARPTAAMTSTLDLPGKANLYPDNNPAHWRTNLPMYAGTVTSQLYDGIDLHTTGVDGQLKTTYVVAPGADPSRIRWRYQGHTSVALDAQGNLVVSLPAPANTLTDTEVLSSTLTELAPTASQTINEREVAVPVRFSIGPDGSVSFALGAYDPTQPLIIDPTLVYSTYLGSAGLLEDGGVGIGVDAAGNSYIATSDGVTKLNPTGSAVLYTTGLYGFPADIAVDSAGNAYLTGTTLYSGFPTLNGYQTSCNLTDPTKCSPEGDAFVTKLGPSGTMLYSSYLGGSDGDHGQGIAVDSSGNAYLTGSTGSADFPTKTPIQTTGSIFVTKINPAAAGAASLVYSTRLGNNGANLGGGIAVDSSGAAYVSGYTTATNFTTTAGVIRPTHTTTEGEGFVVKLNAAGTARVYATYIGGSGSDDTRRIVVDNAGNAAVIGDTTSTDLAIVNGAQAACGDSGCTLGDGFVLQLNATASAIRYSTYQGGSGIDYGIDLAVDTQGILYTTGYASSGFPVTLDAFRSVVSGFNDAYVTTLNPAGVGAASRVYSTLVGGNGDDLARGIAVDTAGNAYITGETESSDLATPGAAQTVYSGDQTAAFATKIGITGRRISHTYDGLERLIGTVEAPGNSFAYGYDPAGNRTSVQVNGAAPVITSYNLANQITNAGYSYDNAGNLANDGTVAYTFDALHRMTARGGTTYAYNGDGTLVSQLTSGVTTRYTQDLAAPLSQVLQTQVGAAARTDSLFALGRIATLHGSTRTWYVSDALGSVRRTVSDAGVPLGIVSYDPWGTVESGTVPVFGFTGELQDPVTGLVNLRARWYSTGQGRFASVDPFAGAAETPYSLHPYQYAYSAPTVWSDPSGRYVPVDAPGTCPAGSRWSGLVRTCIYDSSVIGRQVTGADDVIEFGIGIGRGIIHAIEGVALLAVAANDPQLADQLVTSTAQQAAVGAKFLYSNPRGALNSLDARDWGEIAFLLFGGLKGIKGIGELCEPFKGNGTAVPTRFITNKALRLTGLSEADIDLALLRKGWQKGQQTGKYNVGEPLWWKEVDGVRYEIRLHPHASTNPNLPADAFAKHGGISRYGIQLVNVELDASGRAPTIGSPKLREVYEIDAALRLEYGDASTTMPGYNLHYLDPYGYAYVDDAGNLTPVAANESHFPIKGHPLLSAPR